MLKRLLEQIKIFWRIAPGAQPTVKGNWCSDCNGVDDPSRNPEFWKCGRRWNIPGNTHTQPNWVSPGMIKVDHEYCETIRKYITGKRCPCHDEEAGRVG